MPDQPRITLFQRLLAWLDFGIAAVVSATRWLALPLVALLFLQWPLRDWVKHWSREANDLGQITFALYVAVAITAATRARAHLATDAVAQHFDAAKRARLLRLLAMVVLVPWSLCMLAAGWPPLRLSIGVLEAFPDTANPGYFVVKASGMVLVVLVLAQALVDAFSPARPRP